MSTTKFVEVGLPSGDDKEEWAKFWKSNKQPWRTEPRISKERQHELDELRKIKPDDEQRNYPFKDIKLSRADVEWLLSTHDNYHGPVNWNDESQREREGLDLRGADLRYIDLQGLPLARIIAGPRSHQIIGGQYEAATIHLEGANLQYAHLEEANLGGAHLEEANLLFAYLGESILSYADLEGADLGGAHLEGASLDGAHLEGANLATAHLEGAFLFHAYLEGASLDGVFFDRSTNLDSLVLSNKVNDTASLSDILWGDVNVAVVDWSVISTLGDENEAEDNKSAYGYETATRAYRQLSVVLRNQGLVEHAARFSYRAQLMQRKVFWHRRRYLSYLGSLFLDFLSGYGYKVGRCFIAYALVIGIFAMIYHMLGTNPAWNEAIVISMTAFHGRGFFPEQFHPGDPQALAAAIEAFVGLLIEITLIATLTQRFFGK